MGLSKLKTFNTIIITIASSAGSQPGTPVYQAPEIPLDRQSANTKTDVWSLVCTLIEIFVEEPILSGIDDEVIRNIETKMKIQAMLPGLESLLENSRNF